MTFPVYFHLFGLRIHPHPVMEGIAYIVGFSTMLVGRKRRRELHTERDWTQTLWLTAGAALGALIISKLLAWLEGPAPATLDNVFTGGKTIVGGLAGGWLGTEIAKRALHLHRCTGDAWVLPLCASIAIGRWGCFLTGLSDNTYGDRTSLPWAVDFGDGPRHPTQLYESFFALLLFLAFLTLRKRALPDGARFRLFMLAYMLFRFFVEFLKPSNKPLAGLSFIQVAALLTAACALISLRSGKPIPGIASTTS